MNTDRLSRLINLLESNGFDALALNPGPSLTYLTGLEFHLMERPTVLLVAPPAQPILILPELEIPKLKLSRIPLQGFTYNDNPVTWAQAFQDAAQTANLAGKKLAVEPTRLRFLELEFLQKAAPSAKIVSGESALNQLRLYKDAEELAAMRRAGHIARLALEATLTSLKIGITEREAAAELTANMLRFGSDTELPFPPIVEFGENCANPHGYPTDRRLKDGDLILFDWGARYKGYCSDITRVFAKGKIDPEFERIYSLVLEANSAGRAAGKPGLRAGDIDRAARDVIVRGGYGPNFNHRTGHGLGMEAHEQPYIFAENDLVLTEGMVYTVEPGIYLTGKGGVRIEDNVVVTRNGSESLTDYPRELTIL